MKWKAAIIARPPRLTKCQFRNVFVPCPAPHTLLSPPLSPPPQNYSKQLLQKKISASKTICEQAKKNEKKPFPENEKIVLKTEFKNLEQRVLHFFIMTRIFTLDENGMNGTWRGKSISRTKLCTKTRQFSKIIAFLQRSVVVHLHIHLQFELKKTAKRINLTLFVFGRLTRSFAISSGTSFSLIYLRDSPWRVPYIHPPEQLKLPREIIYYNYLN